MTMDNLPASSMTREEARRLTDEIKADVEDFLEKVTPKLIRMYIEGGWYALGYETWDEYCEADLGSIRLPKALRTQTVLTLRHAGLTIRPIAKALGLSHGTVGAIVKDADGPQWVKGPDGKYYPASSPTKTDESESEKPETPTDLAEIEAGVREERPMHPSGGRVRGRHAGLAVPVSVPRAGPGPGGCLRCNRGCTRRRRFSHGTLTRPAKVLHAGRMR